MHEDYAKKVGQKLQKAHADYEKFNEGVNTFMLTNKRGCLKQALKKRDAAKAEIAHLRSKLWTL